MSINFDAGRLIACSFLHTPVTHALCCWECWCRALLSREASCCSRENNSLLLPLPHCGDLLQVFTGTRRWACYQITHFGAFSYLWWLSAEAPPSGSARGECLCEPKAFTAKQHLEKPVGLLTAWLESLCTCWVAFCSLWMIVKGNTVCAALCYTSIMWQDTLILNWKLKWEMCRGPQLMNSESFVESLMIHGVCFGCRDLSCWSTLACTAGVETLT